MKKFKSVLLFVLVILVALAFTVPDEKEYEQHVNEELKAASGEGILGLNNVMNNLITEGIIATSEYNDLKVGSTYRFSLSDDNEFVFIGFGTMVFKVKGEFPSK